MCYILNFIIHRRFGSREDQSGMVDAFKYRHVLMFWVNVIKIATGIEIENFTNIEACWM